MQPIVTIVIDLSLERNLASGDIHGELNERVGMAFILQWRLATRQ